MKAELKRLLMNIITFEDDVDKNGMPARKATYKKDFLRGINGLRDALLDHMQLGVVAKGIKVEEATEVDIEWVPAKDAPQGKRVIREKYDDEVIELDDQMLQALKFYYKQRMELPIVANEVIDALDDLLKKAKKR